MVKGGAGRGGAGRGTKPGRGHGKARKSADTAGVPKRSGELGACKDMEDKMFVLSVNNKAKDGNVFCKTLEAIVTYVGQGATDLTENCTTASNSGSFYQDKVDGESSCTSGNCAGKGG